MDFPTDLAEQVSPGLARAIQAVLDDPDRQEDASLAMVQETWNAGLADQMVEEERIDIHDKDVIADELRDLIERFGEEQAATRFLRFRASDTLSVVISEVLDRRSDIQPPATLGEVREAVQEGLIAELVGTGDIDPDHDETLLDELDALIRVNGEDALAETLIGRQEVE